MPSVPSAPNASTINGLLSAVNRVRALHHLPAYRQSITVSRNPHQQSRFYLWAASLLHLRQGRSTPGTARQGYSKILLVIVAMSLQITAKHHNSKQQAMVSMALLHMMSAALLEAYELAVFKLRIWRPWRSSSTAQPGCRHTL